jgi:hypothetical protein
MSLWDVSIQYMLYQEHYIHLSPLLALKYILDNDSEVGYE